MRTSPKLLGICVLLGALSGATGGAAVAHADNAPCGSQEVGTNLVPGWPGPGGGYDQTWIPASGQASCQFSASNYVWEVAGSGTTTPVINGADWVASVSVTIVDNVTGAILGTCSKAIDVPIGGPSASLPPALSGDTSPFDNFWWITGTGGSAAPPDAHCVINTSFNTTYPTGDSATCEVSGTGLQGSYNCGYDQNDF